MSLDGFGRVTRVHVDAFALDKYEATVGRVRAWVSAGRPLPEDGEVLHDEGTGKPYRWSAKAKVQDAKSLAGWARYDTWGAGNERRPKNFINWHTALAFCHYEGGRLPTEAEWKYAVAGGSEARPYPWGSEGPTPERAIFNCTGDGDQSCSLADILEVGSRPSGAGRWGHMDLAGSMFEWTMGKDTAGGYQEETSRGGGFCYIGGVDRRARTDLKPLVFRREAADTVSHMVGVRCAYAESA
jgi:sulfatase modifying factor 1